MNYRFGVVIPHFSRPLDLLKSVDSVIEQSCTVNSIVIIDDYSPLSVYHHVLDLFNSSYYSQFDIRIFRNSTNLGPSISRNVGCSYLKDCVDIICFLDSDDQWHTEKISIINELYSTHIDVDMIYHDYSDKLLTLNPSGIAQSVSLFRCLLSNSLQSSCLTQRVSSFHGFNPSFRYSEDYEYLLMSFCYHHSILYVSDQLTLLGRPENTSGGLSEKRLLMRFFEAKAYFSFILQSRNPLYFLFVFPIYIAKLVKEFLFS